MINELSKEIHENNKAKGFYEDEKNIGEMLMLIVTEVAEACEADRENRFTENNVKGTFGYVLDDEFQQAFKENVKDTFEDEIADAMIRLMDIAAYKGIDIETHIRAKVRYNTLRPYKHGKKY